MSWRSRIYGRMALAGDLVAWRHQVRNLRLGGGVPSRGVALFCDLMTMVSSAKIDAILAAGLRTAGHEIVVLLRARTRLVEAIFRATGPTRFVYMSDVLTDADQAQAAATAEQLLERPNAVQNLANMECDGFRIGRNAMSLATRNLRAGQIDLTVPSHRQALALALQESLLGQLAATRVVADLQPTRAIFCERGYSPAGEVFDACLLAGVDVVQWLSAPQSDSLLFKRYKLDNRDQHPLSLDLSTWADLCRRPLTEEKDRRVITQLQSHYASGAWFNRQQLQEGKQIKTREEVQRQLRLNASRPTAIIFSHLFYDATFFYGTSLFKTYEHWLIEAVRAAIDNPHLNWRVKVHPVNVWRSRVDGSKLEQLEVAALQREFGTLPPHIDVIPADTDINTWSLFQAIDYGLTVRGTVGIELPCFGIPVVTAGSGRYSARGFTIDPATPAEFRDTLLGLHKVERLPEDTAKLARLYAYGTFFLRPHKITSFAVDYNSRSRVGALSSNVSFRSGSDATAADIAEVIRWMVGSSARDFVTGAG